MLAPAVMPPARPPFNISPQGSLDFVNFDTTKLVAALDAVVSIIF